MNKFLITALLLISNFCKGQDSLIYKCNIEQLFNCDSLRYYNSIKETETYNFKKMLKRDEHVINFLNKYQNTDLSVEELTEELKRVHIFYPGSKLQGDTVWHKYIIEEKGLTTLQIYVWIKNNRIIKRSYHLEINNRSLRFNQPLSYHYELFKLLNFCLPRRYSCYSFAREF